MSVAEADGLAERAHRLARRAPVQDRVPHAVVCADPFHVVGWANDALSRVHIDAWNGACALARTEPKALSGWARRSQVRPGHDSAKQLKVSRFALWRNPENLSAKEQDKLAWIAASQPRPHRAHLLKEAPRVIFRLPIDQARTDLEAWIRWARRCRIPAFVELAQRIVRHRERILAAIEHGMSNGRVESVNTKI